MKTLIKFLAAIALIAIATPAQALPGDDEQWSHPNSSQLGYHEVAVEDTNFTGGMFSMLSASKGAEQFTCKSLTDPVCADADRIGATQLLGVCDDKITIDCIESLSAIDSSGKEFAAKFKEYIYYNHPNSFEGDGVRLIRYPMSPSSWTIPEAKHAHGEMYTIVVGANTTGKNKIEYSDLYMKLYPTQYGPDIGEVVEQGRSRTIPTCYDDKVNGSRKLFCSSGGPDQNLESGTSRNIRCAFLMQRNGTCLLQRAFPEGLRFKIALRLSAEPTGFFHGRMNSPSVEISNTPENSVKLSISAGSVRVPTFFYKSDWATTDEKIKNWWNTCLPSRVCNVGTRVQYLDNSKEPDGAKRNALYSPSPFQAEAMDAINFFAPYANESSVSNPSVLNFRTLIGQEMAGANACILRGSGLTGIVTTNATAYSAGPPKLVNGQLSYKVAGVHFGSDGVSVNEGSYDLVLRSDVARCIYGFSKAPVQASISVVSAAGETKTATTKVSEKDGWLKLSAYGFTYSSPTISVKLTQASAKKTTIMCVKGKLTKKVTAVGPKCPVGYKKS